MGLEGDGVGSPGPPAAKTQRNYSGERDTQPELRHDVLATNLVDIGDEDAYHQSGLDAFPQGNQEVCDKYLHGTRPFAYALHELNCY